MAKGFIKYRVSLVPLFLLALSIVSVAEPSASDLGQVGVGSMDGDVSELNQLSAASDQGGQDINNRQWYEQRWRLKQQTEQLASELPFVLVPHQMNYILPITLIENPNQQPIEYQRSEEHSDVTYQQVEIEMQLSVKYRLEIPWVDDAERLEFAYSNRSYWQAYNGVMSYSFREVIHQPELMYTRDVQSLEWLEQVSLSLNHESNGRDGPASRSWNRVILSTVSLTDVGLLKLSGWWRIPEFLRTEPYDTGDPENTEMIEDYFGYGEVGFIHALGGQKYSLNLRNNFDLEHNRTSVTLGWTFPLGRGLEGFVQYFNGYGPALIDFNSHQQRLGFGFKLSDWL